MNLLRPAAAVAALLLSGCVAGILGEGRSVEERLTDNLWAVDGISTNAQQARQLALYRGAVLVKAAGYSHMQVVGLRAPATRRGFRLAASPVRAAFLQVTGANDPGPPQSCNASVVGTAMCATFAVDDMIPVYGLLLGRTSARIEQEVAAARAAEALIVSGRNRPET